MADYRDYVIVDGRFVGRFDEMYRDCDDPWEQSQTVEGPVRQATIALMRDAGIKTVVEYGSGLGYYTEALTAAGFDVIGLDISPMAVERASARRPDLRFHVHDMTTGLFPARADAILFAALTWYILPSVDRLWDEMRASRQSQFFVQILDFYPPNVQQYGREYFTTLDECVARCPLRLCDRSVHGAQTSAIWAIE